MPSMMEQYRSIKDKHPQSILLFRLGDFYEMFDEDAVAGSEILDLTLTQRQGRPMCGVPYHAVNGYITKLLQKGRKVSICEQVGDPKTSKGIVDREVIETITPGTSVRDDFLDQKRNNFLLCCCIVQQRACFAWADVSTGMLRAYSVDGSQGAQALRALVMRISPREVLAQQSMVEKQEYTALFAETDATMLSLFPDWSFDIEKAQSQICRIFKVSSAAGFGFDSAAPELAALGVILQYIGDASATQLASLKPPARHYLDLFVDIDDRTIRNLELVQSNEYGSSQATLLSIVDFSRTPMGGRMLREWILQPLRNPQHINDRLDSVEALYRHQRELKEIRQCLSQVRDVERLCARLATERANARDLLMLKQSCEAAMTIEAIACTSQDFSLLHIFGNQQGGGVENCSQFVELIRAGIIDEPSPVFDEGNLIRSGFNARLDELRELKNNANGVLEEYIKAERLGTGIANLRLRYNRIIGYYIEVSKGKLDAVPEHFVRRQSVVGGERFTTQRLGELERELDASTEAIIELERSCFFEIRQKALSFVEMFDGVAKALAHLDCCASFAWAATEYGYTRPIMILQPVMHIKNGRHPVIETLLPQGQFIPNDLDLDATDVKSQAFGLITAPNMAGKSTLLRQTALIAILAHCGSFVPADSAEIGIIDRIYCRVGAHDNLARGESTFLVEMTETAHILNTASQYSLVILDELGRGTSTTDGLAIAQAVCERLLDSIGCRTLFATHFHELTTLEHARLANFSLAVLEEGETIVFLKKLEKKPAAASYGIHVASLAGVPSDVIERARALRNLLLAQNQHKDSAIFAVENSITPASHAQLSNTPNAKKAAGTDIKQPVLFSIPDLVADELLSLDLDKLTPLQALNVLAKLRGMLAGKK